MPEILTESFCERCGTRYTFESATSRGPRLKGLKVVSRGLKNFVLSDDTSMDEAMAAARSETDREVTSHQLDAFHKAFSFCMSCRQYTCGNCWNEVEGRCLSCAPHLGHEILPAPFTSVPDATITGNGGNGHVAVGQNGHEDPPRLDALSWPTADLVAGEDLLAPVEAIDDGLEPIDLAARLGSIDAPVEPPAAVSEPIDIVAFAVEPDPIDHAAAAVADRSVAPEAIDAEPTPIEPEPSMVADPASIAAADPPPGSVGLDERAAAAVTRTSDLLKQFRPGQSLDDAIEAYERDQEPAGADAPTPEPVAAVEPEPVAAVEPEPVAAVEPEPREDVVAQPTWQIVAPDSATADGVAPPATPGAPETPQPVAASAEPQWPTQPEWPSQRPASGLPFLGRPTVRSGGMEALWAESAREVATAAATGPITARATGGVQPCVSCGLSLSASARFCRRCGSPQG